MHLPVLLKEVIEVLDLKGGDVYLDATLGEGGHAEKVFEKFGESIEIAGIDADSEAVEASRERLKKAGANPKFGVLNFRYIDKAPEVLRVERPNKILFDLGWSKSQFERGERGFSFQKDEPLIMTFAKGGSQAPGETGFTAYDIVNHWQKENIKSVIESYGEERFANRIAEQIVEERKTKEIKTTFELREIIKRATPIWYHFKRIDPATKTFQALRIAVNDELRALEEGLGKAFEILKEDGRLSVISFHSLEDRIVKNFHKSLKEEGKAEILTKKPIIAGEEEIKKNPRARSAKLRAIKKL